MQTSFYAESFIYEPVADSPARAHASCIIETSGKNLLAVWYENGLQDDSYYYGSGDWDKTGDVHIKGSWFLKESGRWGTPFIMADTYGVSDNNPCLAIDQQNRLWLFYVTLMAAPVKLWESALLRYKISTEYEGLTPPRWEKEEILILHSENYNSVIAGEADKLRRSFSRSNKNNVQTADALLEKLKDPFNRVLGWMPRVHPIIRKDGTLILPLANENFNVAAMAMTSDGGESWKMSDTIPGLGVVQPSVVPLKDGRFTAFFRDASNCHRIMRSKSFDQGYTWSEVTATELPNPGSGVEAIVLQNGHLLMVYNDKEEGRDRLAVSISQDEGDSWEWTRHIEDRQGHRFCYPSVIQSEDERIHITYSYDHRTIKHVCFNENWIIDSDEAELSL